MTPPPVGPFNPTGADDTTDAYDTIDWLIKNVPESNGRVGMIGSSYEGFTVVMALLHPHPALKVAAPESPMIDGWMGDDWFHYGAFRQTNYDYFLGQTSAAWRGRSRTTHPYARRLQQLPPQPANGGDSWATSQRASINCPYWQTVEASSGVRRLLAIAGARPPDRARRRSPCQRCGSRACGTRKICGAPSTRYRAWEPQDKHNNMNFLVMGPWRHSQINREGRTLGPFTWANDTALEWRRESAAAVLQPAPRSPVRPRPQTRRLSGSTTPHEDHWDTYEVLPCDVCEKWLRA